MSHTTFYLLLTSNCHVLLFIVPGIDRGFWDILEDALSGAGLSCSRSQGRYPGQTGDLHPCTILFAEKPDATLGRAGAIGVRGRVPLSPDAWQVEQV